MQQSSLRGTRWLGTVAVGLVAAAWPSMASADVINVRLTTPDDLLTAGDRFSVAVLADVAEELVGFGFDLDVEAGLIRFDEFVVNQQCTSFASPDGDGIGGLAYPDYIIGNDVLLGTAVFTALAPGEAEISGGMTEGDPTEGFALRGGGFAVPSFGTLTVSIGEPFSPSGGGGRGAVPEPTTLIFVAVGGFLVIAGGGVIIRVSAT